MKICITGGLGFVFSHVVEHFIQNYDHELLNVDMCSYAAHTELIGTQSRQSFGSVSTRFDKKYAGMYYRRGDVSDSVVASQIMDYKPDVIICAHAESHVDNSIKDPYPFYKSNVMGTLNMLEVARTTKAKFIYISTDEVIKHYPPEWVEAKDEFYGWENYAQSQWVFDRAEEGRQLAPSSPYSASKASAELLVGAYKKTHGIEATIVRPTNIYGPRQHPEKLISKTITNAVSNKTIPIYGDGSQWRDYLYVDDFVIGFDLIFNRFVNGDNERIWHISANEERQNIEVVKDILNTLDKPHSLIEFVEDRPGHDISYSLDSFKVRRLGWSPKMEWKEGLNKTINYYLENMYMPERDLTK